MELSESQKSAIENCNFVTYDECIRLHDKDGNHRLSILRCHDGGGFDYATPDGEVVWADCDGENYEFVEMLAKHFLISDID